MRLRLLIDVEVAEEKLPALAEMIAHQPVVGLAADDDAFPSSGRFMGAREVYADA